MQPDDWEPDEEDQPPSRLNPEAQRYGSSDEEEDDHDHSTSETFVQVGTIRGQCAVTVYMNPWTSIHVYVSAHPHFDNPHLFLL